MPRSLVKYLILKGASAAVKQAGDPVSNPGCTHCQLHPFTLSIFTLI